MEQHNGKNENFGIVSTLGTIRGALTLLGLSAAAIAAYNSWKTRARQKKIVGMLNYMSSKINPRTMRIEPEASIAGAGNDNFSILSPILGLAASTGAFMAFDKAVNYYTSQEYKTKKKIEEKHNRYFDKWSKKRYDEVKQGLVSPMQYDQELKIMKKKVKTEAQKEYDHWKEREELIKQTSRDFYDQLQREIPKNLGAGAAAQSNFALFKDFQEKRMAETKPGFIDPKTHAVKVEPSIKDFLLLDVLKNVTNKLPGAIAGALTKKGRLVDAVKKLMVIELKIDMMKFVSNEEKEKMKFAEFKKVLAEFPRYEDVEKIFQLKESFEKKIKSEFGK